MLPSVRDGVLILEFSSAWERAARTCGITVLSPRCVQRIFCDENLLHSTAESGEHRAERVRGEEVPCRVAEDRVVVDFFVIGRFRSQKRLQIRLVECHPLAQSKIPIISHRKRKIRTVIQRCRIQCGDVPFFSNDISQNECTVSLPAADLEDLRAWLNIPSRQDIDALLDFSDLD